jgi:protein TonB
MIFVGFEQKVYSSNKSDPLDISTISLIQEKPKESKQPESIQKPKQKEILKTPEPLPPKPAPKKKIPKKIVKKQKLIKKSKPKARKKNAQKNVSKPAQSQQKSYITKYRSLIYEAIQKAKHYPRIAVKLKKEGTVHMRFTLMPDGTATAIQTTGAHSILQKAAKECILKACKDFPKPIEAITINVPIKYQLER